MPISINVDVTKLDKSKFFRGKKGTYADLVLWETEPNSESADYGDFIVKQKAERGEKSPILGNGKFFELKERAGGNRGRKTREREDDTDKIPF